MSLDEETVALLATHQARCEALAAECDASLSPSSFLFSHEVDFSALWRPGTPRSPSVASETNSASPA